MAIAHRLKRLEASLGSNVEPARRSFHDDVTALTGDSATVEAWLAQHGYGNCLEALAAGESGPELLTDGWSLVTFGEIERDTIEERTLAASEPGVSLWFHHARGWCAPIKKRLVYLGPREDYGGVIARYQALKAECVAR